MDDETDYAALADDDIGDDCDQEDEEEEDASFDDDDFDPVELPMEWLDAGGIGTPVKLGELCCVSSEKKTEEGTAEPETSDSSEQKTQGTAGPKTGDSSKQKTGDTAGPETGDSSKQKTSGTAGPETGDSSKQKTSEGTCKTIVVAEPAQSSTASARDPSKVQAISAMKDRLAELKQLRVHKRKLWFSTVLCRSFNRLCSRGAGSRPGTRRRSSRTTEATVLWTQAALIQSEAEVVAIYVFRLSQSVS